MILHEINNLVIQKGTDFSKSIPLYNEDKSPLGINSSFSGVSKLRKHPSSNSAYSFRVGLDTNTSSVSISMASSITSQLPSGRCYFDILLTYGTINPLTEKTVYGTIMVNDTVSL